MCCRVISDSGFQTHSVRVSLAFDEFQGSFNGGCIHAIENPQDFMHPTSFFVAPHEITPQIRSLKLAARMQLLRKRHLRAQKTPKHY
jgi:hypothetical protein